MKCYNCTKRWIIIRVLNFQVWVYRLSAVEEAASAPGREELKEHGLESSKGILGSPLLENFISIKKYWNLVVSSHLIIYCRQTSLWIEFNSLKWNCNSIEIPFNFPQLTDVTFVTFRQLRVAEVTIVHRGPLGGRSDGRAGCSQYALSSRDSATALHLAVVVNKKVEIFAKLKTFYVFLVKYLDFII